MKLQRPQYLVLFLFWLFTFLLLWKVFCKLETAVFYGSTLLREAAPSAAHTENGKRSVVKPAFNLTLSSGKEETSAALKSLLKSGETIDVKKELRKIQEKHSCKPEENILFIKTHKTGGSTITNILNRFGDLRELMVAIPAVGDNRFQWPSKFHWTFADLLRLDGETANILCNHARYNREQMEIVMKRNTKYVTILREPVSQFVSSFYYFEVDHILGLQHRKDPLEEFLTDPDHHLYSLSIRKGDLPDVMNLIQNGMMYDLGYDFLEFANRSVLSNAITRLEDELDLVLLMEYFDESLVLMMREFCWNFDDILYIKMNAMKYKKRKVADATRKKILNWNTADVTLYRRFNQTFWTKVKHYGDEFWQDVSEFRRRNAEMLKICSPREVEEKAFRLNVTIKGLVMGQKVGRFHRSFCRKLMMTEVQYLDYFRYKLGKSYGYQKILYREGMPMRKDGELRYRLNSLRKASLRLGKK